MSYKESKLRSLSSAEQTLISNNNSWFLTSRCSRSFQHSWSPCLDYLSLRSLISSSCFSLRFWWSDIHSSCFLFSLSCFVSHFSYMLFSSFLWYSISVLIFLFNWVIFELRITTVFWWLLVSSSSSAAFSLINFCSESWHSWRLFWSNLKSLFYRLSISSIAFWWFS